MNFETQLHNIRIDLCGCETRSRVVRWSTRR